MHYPQQKQNLIKLKTFHSVSRMQCVVDGGLPIAALVLCTAQLNGNLLMQVNVYTNVYHGPCHSARFVLTSIIHLVMYEWYDLSDAEHAHSACTAHVDIVCAAHSEQ